MEPLPGTENQSAAPRAAVSNDPGVLVTDSADGAVEGATVMFEMTQCNGSIAMMSATTGPDGIASAGQWTLGPAEGTKSVEASG